MCTTCGCAAGEVTIEGQHPHHDGHEHPHGHDHDHGHTHVHADGTVHTHSHEPEALVHSHAPGVSPSRMVQIEQDILAKNDDYAARNRARLAERGIFALNLVSSPGSGKTTLLCRTIEMLQGAAGGRHRRRPADQQRCRAHPRHRRAGRADQHRQGLPPRRAHGRPGDGPARARAGRCLLLIENVGNLVCPAAFDLGEAHKVVILSVTEGEDKPLKYPRHVPRGQR